MSPRHSSLEEAVLEFQKHIGASAPRELAKSDASDAVAQAIRRAGVEVANLSSYLKSIATEAKKAGVDDPRALRAELMMEELGESLEALADRDELALLDGLTDLVYVTVGTATTFALPLTRAFQEVHASNMTKSSTLDHAAGVKGKGPNFRSPNLRRVLNLYRGRIICDKCSFAHGEIRRQAGGGERIVLLKMVGAQKLCGPCSGEMND